MTLNIDYFQFSALARVATPGEGVSVGLVAGPWAAYKGSCEVVGALGEMIAVSTSCDDRNFSDFDIKTLDFGFAFGGGIELPLSGSLRLGLDALYSLGIAEMDDNQSKTRTMTVQAGLVFPIG